MRKPLAVFLAVVLLVPLIGSGFGLSQDFKPKTYSQEFVFTIEIMPNGDASITMKTVLLGPKDEIQKQIDMILNETRNGNMTVEEAIARFEKEQLRRYIESLTQSGMNLTNESIKAYGIQEGNNITVVFSAVAINFAKYYSYSDYWEVQVDPTRGYANLNIPDTGLPFAVDINNTFIIKLPENSTLISYPRPFIKQYNASRFSVSSEVEGGTVVVKSSIYLEPFLPPEGYKELFGDYKDYYIRYKAPYKGEEHYQSSVMNEYVTLDIYANGSVRLHMRDEYIEPKEEVRARKAEIISYGVQNVTEFILRTYSLALGYQGVLVDDGKVKILGLNETDAPLVIDAEYILRNFTRYENGSYVYQFDPTLGITNGLTDRVEYEVNHTLYLTLNFPEGAEILEVPDNITAELKGNRLTVRVFRERNSVRVVSNVFIRYGATVEDVNALLSNYTSATVRYTLPAERGGLSETQQAIAVAVALILLVGAVAFWKRR
ncbi:exodeoxyribonuclease VII small subunit [Thermococcus sp. M36]|uniref:exodeoxyribonuclease VII small subunit n=1 Tax=Thermococcus sp. M36 TaxID=1638261 RepID=UPI001439B4BD|nr:exodeoxyribonuclease VII small subunit [Thermococcus sp. M36]NJE04771.1 exodeoxyribonuclease VII small subunit [Thermococcus sp. M36]